MIIIHSFIQLMCYLSKACQIQLTIISNKPSLDPYSSFHNYHYVGYRFLLQLISVDDVTGPQLRVHVIVPVAPPDDDVVRARVVRHVTLQRDVMRPQLDAQSSRTVELRCVYRIKDQMQRRYGKPYFHLNKMAGGMSPELKKFQKKRLQMRWI